jgi:glycosyltransferase involved in cell wall biosynthesis
VKILIISPTQSGIGGIAQHVQGLTNFLKKHDHEVEIISSENTFTIPIKGLKNPSFMISSFLKAKFKKNQDIVHAHNIPAALAMKNAGGKKVLSLHGIFSQQINRLHGNTTGDISEKYEKDALRWADAITVISKEAYDYYSKLGYNVSQVPNAIDISSLEKNADKRYPKQVIFAGRLSREKGTDSLISIAQKLSDDIHLIVLGAGPEEHKIKDLAKTHKNIHFLGYQNKKETISLIRGSDILIQPSLQEGISSTLLEAMACKTAIIASDVGGNKEIIQNGITGILVEAQDIQSFVKEITNLLHDDQLRETLVNQASKNVEKYDWNHVGNLYLNIYKSILNQSK